MIGRAGLRIRWRWQAAANTLGLEVTFSKPRHKAFGYYFLVPEDKTPKRCRWCRGGVNGRRRTFCSDHCVHEWRLRSSTSYLRKCVLKRDRGICALCGIDTVAMRRGVMKLPLPARLQELRELGEQGLIGHTRKSWWEADHILPVVEGGDSNLENLRTLCHPCHRGVTTELRLRRKHARSRLAATCE